MTVNPRGGRLQRIRRALMPWIFFLMLASLLADVVVSILAIVHALVTGQR